MTQRILLFLFSSIVALFVTLFEPACVPCCAAESAKPSAIMTPAEVAGNSIVDCAIKDSPLPNQYGMSAEYGYSYDPKEDITFLLARVFAIYDYGSVWNQNRSKNLRFKVEGAAGSTLTPVNDLILSANILALYYPDIFGKTLLRPYIEAGIGLIYTQFRVPGQGLNINFNPLLGVGCELPQENGKNIFAAIRMHHLSNSNFYHDNRGVNSVELQIGRFF
jgi:hypothetical protein